jgi:hypothetical protein
LNLRGRKWWETGEDYIVRSFITCTIHQILLCYNQIKEDEIGRACNGIIEKKTACKILVGRPEGKDPLKGIGLDGRVLLEWVLKYGIGCGLDSSGSDLGPVPGSCEHGNEASDPLKGGEILH